MNLDPRSRSLNTEVAVFAQSTVLGERLGTLFDDAVRPSHAFKVALTKPGNAKAPLVWTGEDGGKIARYTAEPRAGFWRRFSAKFLNLFLDDNSL